jgi:homoserine dehydrogenase
VIELNKLLEDGWWKQPGISLILTPSPILENIELRSLKKKSLELAGVL